MCEKIRKRREIMVDTFNVTHVCDKVIKDSSVKTIFPLIHN